MLTLSLKISLDAVGLDVTAGCHRAGVEWAWFRWSLFFLALGPGQFWLAVGPLYVASIDTRTVEEGQADQGGRREPS